MAFFYVVATPIGNLKDITLRALETLKGVDLILCEDTRNTKKILDFYNIGTLTESYHQHSSLSKTEKAIALLGKGKSLAFVCDAGTPCVSDPGSKLIGEILKKGFKVVPVPGASALVAAASISGFPADKFLFLGFPPSKNKRKKFFEEVRDSKYPVIFYESCHRIIKSLEDLQELDSSLEVAVFRELTKKFETAYRGNIEKVIKDVKNSEVKGEFVVAVKKI